MTMKLANPLYYPVAVLVGAIALVVSVRFIKLPNVVALPLAIGIATVGAAVLKGQEPQPSGLDDLLQENPELAQQLQGVRQQALELATKADGLRAEASRLLTQSGQLELLGTVQYACDRAHELPAKVEQMTTRMHGNDSLLSVTELQQQLKEVETKISNSSGVAKSSLVSLAESLQRNIDLARQGQDARQSQVTSLKTLILDAAGTLQALQNKLRTADLTDMEDASEVRSLSNEFKSVQESVDFLVR